MQNWTSFFSAGGILVVVRYIYCVKMHCFATHVAFADKHLGTWIRLNNAKIMPKFHFNQYFDVGIKRLWSKTLKGAALGQFW